MYMDWQALICLPPCSLQMSMLTYLSSYLAMASAFYYVVFEGVMSIIDPGFHDYFIPHSFDVSFSFSSLV